MRTDDDRLGQAFEAFEREVAARAAMAGAPKPWWASRGVVGGLVAAGAGIAGLFGYALSPAETAAIGELVLALTAAVAGLVAAIGRARASRPIR